MVLSTAANPHVSSVSNLNVLQPLVVCQEKRKRWQNDNKDYIKSSDNNNKDAAQQPEPKKKRHHKNDNINS